MLMNINELERIINSGGSVNLNDYEKTNIARIDILEPKGNIDMDEMADVMGANMVQPLEGHKEMHSISFDNQNHYRLYFVLDEQVGIKNGELKTIEEGLVPLIYVRFPTIDVLASDTDVPVEPAETTIIKDEGNGSAKVTHRYFKIDVSEFGEFKDFGESFDEYARKVSKEFEENPITIEELIDRAEHIASRGKLKSGDKLWQSMVIGIWNTQQEGQYDEHSALRIIRALDSNQNTDEYYREYRLDNSDYEGRKSTIGSLVYNSDNEKYSRSYLFRFFVGDDSDDKTTEIDENIIKIERYIDENDMYEIINNDYKNVLIDSPTGSGKTTATTIAVLRWLAEDPENRYAYFALPTIALSDQETASGKYGKALKDREVANVVMRYNLSEMGVNFSYGTFDKSVMYTDQAFRDNKNAEVLVIADESHKEVFDYFFRKKAIRGLFGLREKVSKFIGLSGTPQEIDKDEYDKLVKFELIDDKPIFNNLKVLTYDREADFKPMIAEIIKKEVNEGRKVLQFINNKEIIEEERQVLEEEGIKVVTIYQGIKDEDQIIAYNYLMNEQKFPEGYDVVLATSIISDGVNILNDNEDYSVIISPSRRMSPIFNLSVIKQMSNRFRNQYENIIIPIFIAEHATPERLNHKALYSVESRYQTLLQESTKLAEFLRREFRNEPDEYMPSFYEIASGLPHINSHYDKRSKEMRNNKNFERAVKIHRHLRINPNIQMRPGDLEVLEMIDHVLDHLFTPDKRTLRKTASRDAENYYMYFSSAFINGLEDILEIDATVDLAINYIENSDDDSITKKFEELQKMRVESNIVKREMVRETLSEELYDEVRTLFYRHSRHLGDADIHIALKDALNDIDYKILNMYSPFVDYEDLLNIIESTPVNRGQEGLLNRFRAYQTVQAFDDTTRNSKTNLVYVRVKELLEDKDNYNAFAKGTDYITNSKIKDLVQELADDTGWSVDEIGNTLDNFFSHDSFRGGAGRGKGNFRTINIEDIGAEYGLEEDRAIDVYKNYEKYVYFNAE